MAAAKKASSKKPATKSTQGKAGTGKATKAGKTTTQKSASQRKTIKEIASLMDTMGDNALAMLKQQAKILAHAEELDAARAKMKEAIDKSTAEKAPVRAAGGKRSSTSKKDSKAQAPSKPGVYVEEGDAASFFVGARGKRIFFTRDELRALTRLSHAAGDAASGARRIYTWMQRERQDFLTDTGISRPTDGALKELWDIIVHSYRVS